MDSMTLTFLLVGGLGVVVLLISVVVGDIAHLAFSADADGPFSLPAIAAFVGGGGFGGAIASSLIGDSLPALVKLLIALVAALALALPLAFGAIKLAAGLSHMKTDETLNNSNILGAHGTIITAISSAGAFGEVRLKVGGHLLKYNARSQQPLPVGTPVYVIDVPTSTSVEVVSTAFEIEPGSPPHS